MAIIVEDIVKLVSFISIVPVLFVIIRYWITVYNRTIVELIILPARTRIWEDFLEKVLLTILLTAVLIIPVLVGDFNIDNNLISMIFIWMVFILSLIVLLISMLWILSFFVKKVKEYSNVITFIILFGLMLTFLFLPLITYYLKNQFILGELKFNIIEIFFLSMGVIVIYIIIFFVALTCSNFFLRQIVI